MADPRTGTLQVSEGELSRKGINGRFDQPCLCPTRRFHLPGARLELTVSTAQDYQEIIEPGQEIVPSFMPPFRTPAQHLIVVFSGLLYQPFETDVATHLVAVLIECEECQESRNTAVAVAEAVNTQEVEYEAA